MLGKADVQSKFVELEIMNAQSPRVDDSLQYLFGTWDDYFVQHDTAYLYPMCNSA